MKKLQGLLIKLIITTTLTFAYMLFKDYLSSLEYSNACGQEGELCLRTPYVFHSLSWTRFIIPITVSFIISHILYKDHQKRTKGLSKITLISLALIAIALLYIFLIATFSPNVQY